MGPLSPRRRGQFPAEPLHFRPSGQIVLGPCVFTERTLLGRSRLGAATSFQAEAPRMGLSSHRRIGHLSTRPSGPTALGSGFRCRAAVCSEAEAPPTVDCTLDSSRLTTPAVQLGLHKAFSHSRSPLVTVDISESAKDQIRMRKKNKPER